MIFGITVIALVESVDNLPTQLNSGGLSPDRQKRKYSDAIEKRSHFY
ncbi:MAG: hypothetical protein F6K56_42755 [Moorea sp. SIO3G5]|nr:hypothetical protein [Moorena sp. SIO3G5]